jgi:hypothetical protein
LAYLLQPMPAASSADITHTVMSVPVITDQRKSKSTNAKGQNNSHFLQDPNPFLDKAFKTAYLPLHARVLKRTSSV